MRYISFDVETTGLLPEKHNVLEIAAIIDDTERMDVAIKTLPRFHTFLVRDTYTFDHETLKMNWKLMEQILFGKDGVPRMSNTEVALEYSIWLNRCGFTRDKSIVYAGKNFGSFDKKFMEFDIPDWRSMTRVKHRALDPLAFFFNPIKDDEPPSLVECLKRLGVEGGTHRAVDDAEGVILCLRHGWKSGFYFGADK